MSCPSQAFTPTWPWPWPRPYPWPSAPDVLPILPQPLHPAHAPARLHLHLPGAVLAGGTTDEVSKSASCVREATMCACGLGRRAMGPHTPQKSCCHHAHSRRRSELEGVRARVQGARFLGGAAPPGPTTFLLYHFAFTLRSAASWSPAGNSTLRRYAFHPSSESKLNFLSV